MSLVKLIYSREDTHDIKSVVVKESQVRDIEMCTDIDIMMVIPIKEQNEIKRDYILS